MIASIKRISLFAILLVYGFFGLRWSWSVDAYYQVGNTIGVWDGPHVAITYNNKVYVANRSSNNVSVIDGTTNVVSTIPVWWSPNSIVEHNNRLYVTNYDSWTVSVINPTTNTVISTISVAPQPAGMVEVNNKLYIWEYDGPLFYIIDTVDNSVSTIPSFSEIQDVHAVNDKLYITTFENNNLRVINTINNTTSNILLPSLEYARRLTSIWDILYIRSTNSITVLDTINETLNQIPIPVTWWPSSNMITLWNKIYIANQWLNTISVVDTITNIVLELNVWNNPILFTTLNNKVYVSNYNSDNVSIIDWTDNSVSHITVWDGPMQLTSLNNRVYVTNSLSDTVSIISNIPTISYPANNAILTTNIVTFTWVAEAGSLVSILDNVWNTLTNTIANGNNTFVANYIATGPGIYTVRPRATFNGLINTGSFTTFSILWWQLTFPTNNFTTINSWIVFSGTATSWSTVDILLNGSSIGIITWTINNTFYLNPWINFATWTYTVQPIFSLWNTVFSGSVTTFTIVSTLHTPVITSFANNAVFNTNTILLTWTVSSGVTVSLWLNWSNIWNTIGVSWNTFSYTLSNLLSGNYTIQPIWGLSGVSYTGNITNFAVSPLSNMPVITSFQNNAVFNNNVITVTWSALSWSLVTLYLNNTLLWTNMATSGNIFSYTFSNIANWNYTIQPVATLSGLSQTWTSLNFSYIWNNWITAPVITSPLNNSSNNSSVTFYGNATPWYTVVIVNQVGNTIINGSANSNGIFSLWPVSIPSGTYTVKSLTWSTTIYGNSITITTTYNNNSSSSMDYCPNWDYTVSLYDGLCGTYVNNNNNNTNNPIFPWIDNTTSYNDDDYSVDSDVLSEVCVPYENADYTNELYESLKFYKKDIFVICWMKHNGLTKHTKTGYFRGSDGLRRDESTKFIYNFLTDVLNITPVKKNTFCDYKDLYKYNNDLKNYIKKSCEAGLYKWTQSNANFNPSYFLKTNYFYSIISNMIKVYQPNGDSDVSVLDDISEINKNNTTKMTRLKAAHALYKLSQILYSSAN